MRTLSFLFSVLLFGQIVHSIVVEKTVYAKGNAREFQRFGFESGGTVQITSAVPEKGISLDLVMIFVCNNGDYTSMINAAVGDSVCSQTSTCELSTNLSDPIIHHYSVLSKDYYHLMICTSAIASEVGIKMKYTLLNRDGLQLAIGTEPLPDLYMVLTVLWSLVAVTWLVMWAIYSRVRVALHTLLVVVAFLKEMVVVVALAYWRTCQQTGICYDQLKYLQSFLFALSETTFFCALLLISKGWKITRSRLPSSEVRTIAVALVLLLSTLLFFSFYNDGYYFLSLMIMYFFMLPKIFTSITKNTRLLETHLMLVSHNATPADIDVVHSKIKLFKTLRTSVVTYLGCILLVNSMRIIMVWYLDWFNYVMNEVVVLVMMCVVSYILLPNRYSLFQSVTIPDAAHFPNVDALFNSDMDLFSYAVDTDIADMIVIEYPYDEHAMLHNLHSVSSSRKSSNVDILNTRDNNNNSNSSMGSFNNNSDSNINILSVHSVNTNSVPPSSSGHKGTSLGPLVDGKRFRRERSNTYIIDFDSQSGNNNTDRRVTRTESGSSGTSTGSKDVSLPSIPVSEAPASLSPQNSTAALLSPATTHPLSLPSSPPTKEPVFIPAILVPLALGFVDKPKEKGVPSSAIPSKRPTTAAQPPSSSPSTPATLPTLATLRPSQSESHTTDVTPSPSYNNLTRVDTTTNV